jgi:ATP-dependent helicase/nuclease subunit A
LEPLFGANALAEVDVVATLEDGLPVAGRIDRFVETLEDVRIVDFKTGRPYEKPTPEHLRQLALYRAAVAPMYAGKKIRCYLIFTRTAAIIEANDADLDAALSLARARYRSSGA